MSDSKYDVPKLQARIKELEAGWNRLAESNAKYIHDNKAICERAATAEAQLQSQTEALEKIKFPIVDALIQIKKMPNSVQGSIAINSLEEAVSLAALAPKPEVCKDLGDNASDTCKGDCFGDNGKCLYIDKCTDCSCSGLQADFGNIGSTVWTEPEVCGTCGGSGKAPCICPYHNQNNSICGCVKRPVHPSAKQPCPDCQTKEDGE